MMLRLWRWFRRRSSRPQRHIRRVAITYAGPFFAEIADRDWARRDAIAVAEQSRDTAHFYAGKAADARRYARNAATEAMRDIHLRDAADHERQARGYAQMARDCEARVRRCS